MAGVFNVAADEGEVFGVVKEEVLLGVAGGVGVDFDGGDVRCVRRKEDAEGGRSCIEVEDGAVDGFFDEVEGCPVEFFSLDGVWLEER